MQYVASSLFFAPTNASGIILVVNNLAPKTSCGFDNICVKLLKQIILQIVNHLSKIINKSLCEGIFPNLLKITRIIPVFKSGDTADPKNYRPISLLPFFSKIFKQIINIRLSTFFKKHNFLHASQHGFRTNHSTITAVSEVLNSVTTSLDNIFLSIALYFDISKPFDLLNHSPLLGKFKRYGVR